MTTKRPKMIKPVKAWAVAEEECDGRHTLAPWRMYFRRSEARAHAKKRRDYYRVFGDKIIPVLITPIERKRSYRERCL